MKVLFITSVYPSEDKPSAGVFHQTQADSLKELGVSVQVIAPVPKSPKVLGIISEKYKEYNRFPYQYNWNGIDVYRPRFLAIPGQLKWAQPHKRFASAVAAAIEEHHVSFDVIHAHLAMPAGGAAAILAKKYNKPYIVTLHGSDVNVYPNYSKGAMEAFQFAVNNASEVLAVSDALAVKTAELTGRRPEVLSIGIDMKKFNGRDLEKERRNKLRKELKLPNEKKLLLYVGRLVQEKGLRELEEAINRLDDRFHLVLVGDGPLGDKLKENKKIHLIGALPNNRIKDYLQSADVFVLPSYHEGMPTVIIEALALQVPVLSTNVGGVPELFGEFQHLLIEPRFSNQIVERVTEYIDGAVYSSEIREALFKKVHDKFNVTRNNQDLMKLYTEITK